MIVKPSISFLSDDNDSQLKTDVAVILSAMAANKDVYPTPSPTLVDLQTALDEFSNALALAADGGPSATSAKNNLRLVLCRQVRLLASYVVVACKGDMTNLLLSGFPVQKPARQPIGPLPAPATLTLTLGSHSGELDASTVPVFGTATYNWRVKAASAPTVTVQSAQTTAASQTFTGLTPGVVYLAEVNAVGAAGPSDWTESAPQMVV